VPLPLALLSVAALLPVALLLVALPPELLLELLLELPHAESPEMIRTAETAVTVPLRPRRANPTWFPCSVKKHRPSEAVTATDSGPTLHTL
jgi:hypothetical protein